MKNLRCYAKISISNMLHNFECIKELLPDGCEIIPVIKADAYCHGAIEFAKALCKRVSTFAVAELEEALTLRESGIENRILVLGYTNPSFAAVLADNDITQTVMSLDYAKALSERLGGLSLDIHVKLDTGMHRLGFDATSESTPDEIEAVSRLKGINIKGIFSHYAESDDLTSHYTAVQTERFYKVTSALEERGVDLGTRHISNSAAILVRPETVLDAVRAGIILYGAYPSEQVKKEYLKCHPHMQLKEVMTLCARVGQILHIKAGESVGYCRTHIFNRDSVIATITAGYADGIPRSLSNKGVVCINGELFNVVGNVCMDLLMVDVTDAKSTIKEGDEVIFWGCDELSVDRNAVLADTISYELYTGISQRVARIYS